jgi:outer membrane protein OmpA-like peptidoglycan-associated protein
MIHILPFLLLFSSAVAQERVALGKFVVVNWHHSGAISNHFNSHFTLDQLTSLNSTRSILEDLEARTSNHARLNELRESTHCRIQFVVDLVGDPFDVTRQLEWNPTAQKWDSVPVYWTSYHSAFSLSGFNSITARPVRAKLPTTRFDLAPVRAGVQLEKNIDTLMHDLERFLDQVSEADLHCDKPEPSLPPEPVSKTESKTASAPTSPSSLPAPNHNKQTTHSRTHSYKNKRLKPPPKKDSLRSTFSKMSDKIANQLSTLTATALLKKVEAGISLLTAEIEAIRQPDIYIHYQGCEDSFSDPKEAYAALDRAVAYLKYYPTSKVVIRGWINGEDLDHLGAGKSALDQSVSCGSKSSFANQPVKALMKARAEVAKDYLVMKGISAERIQASTGSVGIGEQARKVVMDYR